MNSARSTEGTEEEGIQSQVLFESEQLEGEGGGEGDADHVLWVDKYSPRNYTELLSDDVREQRAGLVGGLICGVSGHGSHTHFSKSSNDTDDRLIRIS